MWIYVGMIVKFSDFLCFPNSPAFSVNSLVTKFPRCDKFTSFTSESNVVFVHIKFCLEEFVVHSDCTFCFLSLIAISSFAALFFFALRRKS